MLRAAKDLAYRLMPIRKRFERIHARNQWGSEESVSGVGSTLANTAAIRAELPALLAELGVRKVVDVACGDFNWMPEVVAASGVEYQGYDIVEARVALNRERHGSDRVRFGTFDITAGVPDDACDLVLFRDCMLHLSFADGLAALANIARMDAAHVLLSTTPGAGPNVDIVTGRHRSIDLTAAPYDLPPPVRAIHETQRGKLLGLWRAAALARAG